MDASTRMLPASCEPEELRRALAEQALATESNAYRLGALERGCATCRGERVAADSIVIEKLDALEVSFGKMLEDLAAIKAEKSTWTNAVKAVFAIAGLLVAAKAAGVF